jgi:hypothetical protein
VVKGGGLCNARSQILDLTPEVGSDMSEIEIVEPKANLKVLLLQVMESALTGFTCCSEGKLSTFVPSSVR